MVKARPPRLRLLKSGEAALKFQVPPQVVFRDASIPEPSIDEHQRAQKFFQKVAVKLTNLVSSQAEFDSEISSLPAVAFMGRSNVGKSSLLNALFYPPNHDPNIMANKSFAAVANKPGYTKTLNFYNCGDKFNIIDSPGYGYGSRAQQGEAISGLLQFHKNLRRVFVLSSLKEGITDSDTQVMDMLTELGISWQLVITKVDKVIKKAAYTQAPARSFTQASALLSRLSNKSRKLMPPRKYQLVPEDVSGGLARQIGARFDQIQEYPTVFPELVATATVERANFLGIPQLRTSVFRASQL